MKLKYLSLIIMLGSSTCYSTEVFERYHNTENQGIGKRHDSSRVETTLNIRDVTELESQAIKEATSHGLTKKDIESGIASYRKKLLSHPELRGIPFELYQGGMIGFDNYL